MCLCVWRYHNEPVKQLHYILIFFSLLFIVIIIIWLWWEYNELYGIYHVNIADDTTHIRFGKRFYFHFFSRCPQPANNSVFLFSSYTHIYTHTRSNLDFHSMIYIYIYIQCTLVILQQIMCIWIQLNNAQHLGVHSAGFYFLFNTCASLRSFLLSSALNLRYSLNAYNIKANDPLCT